MKAIVYLITLVSYGIEVYHLTQHTEQTAHLLLWYTLATIFGFTIVVTYSPDIAEENKRLPPLYGGAWWFAYFVAWLLHWPEPSSGILIGAAIFLGLRFAATRIDWLIPRSWRHP